MTTIDEEILTRRAPVQASSFDAEAGTVVAVIAAGAAVRRYDERGPYMEKLSPAPEPVEEVPILDNHQRWSVEDIVGTATEIKATGGETRALLTLSRNNPRAQLIRAELADGRRYGASMGYRVSEWREETDPKTGIRTKTAIRWQLLEVSLTPIPADPRAGTRSITAMSETNVTPAPDNPPVQPPPPAQRSEPDQQDRATVNREIRSIGQTLGLDQTWIDTQIDANASPDAARAAALEAVRERGTIAGQVRSISVGYDSGDPDQRIRDVGEALYTRFNHAHEPSERARQYMGQTVLDIARDSLRARSMPTTGLSPAATIERALHTTSDFPLILGDGLGRTIREAYRTAQVGMKQVGRRVTNRDFRERHRLQLSEAPRLEKVNENGEFKSGTLAEAKESFKVDTFGRIIGITRQALVNDDLGAFADLGRRMGQAAAATEAQLLVDLLLANSGDGPKMSDGKNLFHADHGNLAAVGSALDVDGLSAARQAMRKQVGLTGELIDVPPRFLLVPPSLETEAEKLLASITATKESDVNPFAGRLVLVVEPRLTDENRWYVVADPAVIDGLEYAYLEGEEGVVIETKAGFETDGVQIKARLDFGAGFVDHRSWVMSPGA